MSAADTTAWDSFVASRSDGWLYHLAGWKEVVTSAYGHHCPYLLAEQDGKIRGVLPLTEVRSRIFGHSVTSLPYLDWAGVVAESDAVRQALADQAVRMAEQAGARYIEVRQFEPVDLPMPADLHKVTLMLELPDSEEALWKGLPSERRNRIRKAEKAELSVEFAGADRLPTFYDIWTSNMRDLGSPPHSLSFFKTIMRVFPAQTTLAFVKYRGADIGAAMCLYHDDMITVPWVSSLRRYFELYPNNILYWEAMKYAVRTGLKRFDFGRSTVDSGTYTFKKRWGATVYQLYWHAKTFGRDELSRPATDNPKFQLALKVWKKLPVGLTRLIGPGIRKHITA